MATTRRLAAILAADVAGYSRLMGADEEGTHERLKAHLAELIYPKIAEHRGRIVKNTGDGFLAEFASVLDAVRCSVEVQQRMSERNAGIAAPERIELRIGINLGDVIAEPHDIFGDEVNVAARLEGLASPGGVCISGTVREHIGDRLPYAFMDMGEQSVKNIARPMHVYSVHLDATAHSPRVSLSFTVSGGTSVIAPRLSIVVLPFANLSDNREQQYFVDAITEDLTTDLSRLVGVLVISLNTAQAYRNKSASAKDIGHELGIRYVVQGSVRRSGSQVRVTVQMINAETEAHLWAERFDRDIGDVLALQSEITARIANALNLQLIIAEAARPTEHPDALDYVLRGRAVYLKPVSRENHAEAIGWFERALEFDAQSVEAKSSLAGALAGRVLDGMTDTANCDIERAEKLIEQALAVSPRHPRSHKARGQVLRAQGRCDEAIHEYEIVLAFNPNWVTVIAALGWCKFLTGRIDEAISLHEQATRVSPRDNGIGNWYDRIGRIHLLQSRTGEATRWLERARNINQAHPNTHIYLAAAYALEGYIGRAATELADARRLSPDGRCSSIARLKAAGISAASPGYWGVPEVRELFEATFFAGLRKAGMPEK